MELGKDIDTEVVENKIANQQPHQCALLIYTVNAAIIQIFVVCLFYPNSLGQLEILKLLC